MPIFAGCDIGSTTGKVVLMDENQKILGSSIVRSARGPQATADHAMTLALEAAKLERDDGYMVYEIEFYSGGIEYEYTIDAVTGDIIEYDSEHH